MNRLDHLIHDIKSDEALNLKGSLNKASQKRIEKKVSASMAENTPATKKHIRFSKRLTVALAASLVLTLGLTATAARRNEWDITLLNFMGIDNPDTLQLESGEVQINQSVVSPIKDYADSKENPQQEVTMTAVSSIGDQNSAYIRIETDYILPDSFNPETDYVLPQNDSLQISNNNSFGAIFTYYTDENRLGFLLEIIDCKNINRAAVSLLLQDLYLYHDLGNPQNAPERELLCEGSWELQWQFRYESNTKTYHMLKPLKYKDITYYLTKIEVSPISVRMEAFRSPFDRYKEHKREWLEEIHLADGTVLSIDGSNSAGLRNGIFADSYVSLDYLGGAILPEEVEKLVILGEEIKLR